MSGARSFVRLVACTFVVLGGSARAAPSPSANPTPTDPDLARFRAAAESLSHLRGEARGLVPLITLADLEKNAPDLAPFAKVYASCADDPKTDPEVRGLARFHLAELERERGNLKRASIEEEKLGFVKTFQVVGPLDDEGKRAFDAVYPPENVLDLKASMDGKVRPVAWRDLPGSAVEEGFVHLGAVLRPSREVAAYAVAFLDSSKNERALIFFGGSGAAKVWVNGSLAISDKGYHPARLDQRGARITLRKGSNVILVKLAHQDGRMGFYLRLSDERGEGLTFRKGHDGPIPPGKEAAPEPHSGVVERLEKLADRAHGRAEAEARYELALVKDERQSADAEDHQALREAHRAAELRPGFVDARLLLARLEEDHGRRREELDAALAADPKDFRVLDLLARDEIDEGRPQSAVGLLDKAIELAQEEVEPRVTRIEALAHAGLEARAAIEAAEVANRFPTVPEAVRIAAFSARRFGRIDEAASRLRTLLALRFDDREARASLTSLLVDRGDLTGATLLFEEGMRLYPSDVRRRMVYGQFLAANGRSDAAEEAFAGALALAPEDGEVLEDRGRARLSNGKNADALADLERASELRPQDPALKELVRSLSKAREPFEEPYVYDAKALAESAPKSSDDALVLGELKVTRVYPSGLSSTFNQMVVKVLNARGADAFRRHAIDWAPDRQDVKVERARILKSDGSVVAPHEEGERSASEPWYRLYYDTHVRTLSFPALSPGDVLEIAWRVDDTAGENLLSDYFGDMTVVEDAFPKGRFDYVLIVPKSRPIHANTPRGIPCSKKPLKDDLVEYRWSARDVPKIEPEPSMPGFSEIARYVHVSTYANWDQVASFYEGLVRDSLRPGEEVRATAERIVEQVEKARDRSAPGQPRVERTLLTAPPEGGWDATTKRALIEAAYDFVVTQTRYVGLEFGIHGYLPYRVDQVLSRRFGDCKDKASLLHALLEAMGIDSRLVLLRMRRLGTMPAQPASLAIFNHAIVYVPDLDLWLDGTASHSGTHDLPSEDRGATTLVLNPGKPPTFGTIPEASPGDNVLETSFDITLAPDGHASVLGRSRVEGVQAPDYRRAYLAEQDRKPQLEQAFNHTFPGLLVREVSMSDLSRLEDPVSLSFAMDVPHYARPDGDGLRFTPFGSGQRYAEAYASLSKRTQDLVLGDPSETRFTYSYDLPPGWAVKELPEAAAADDAYAGFSVKYRLEGARLLADGHVKFKSGRIPAADYPEFRSLLGKLDRAFDRRVFIAPIHAEVKP